MHVFYEELKKSIVIHIHFIKCDRNKYRQLGITVKRIQVFFWWRNTIAWSPMCRHFSKESAKLWYSSMILWTFNKSLYLYQADQIMSSNYIRVIAWKIKSFSLERVIFVTIIKAALIAFFFFFNSYNLTLLTKLSGLHNLLH